MWLFTNATEAGRGCQALRPDHFGLVRRGYFVTASPGPGSSAIGSCVESFGSIVAGSRPSLGSVIVSHIHLTRGRRSLQFPTKNWTHSQYLLNAFRVLLTRARQGMVICVPEGEERDATRSAAYYDATFQYLAEIGF